MSLAEEKNGKPSSGELNGLLGENGWEELRTGNAPLMREDET